MLAINLEQYQDILTNKSLKIKGERLNFICKKGQGSKTCKYLGCSSIGMICFKNTRLKSVIDDLSSKGDTVAQGDNCEGLRPAKPATKRIINDTNI